MTHYVADLERIEGRWVGFVRGLPGCFVSHPSRDTCFASLSDAIGHYLVWADAGSADDALDVTIGELHDSWLLNADYEVNAFFAADRVPLTGADIKVGMRLLARAHADFDAVIAGLNDANLSRDIEDGWSVRRILSHIASAEWWYLDRLNLAPARGSLPDSLIDRLGYVHSHVIERLPELIDCDLVMSRQMEVWSPRKLLRRALWHMRDHTQHAQRFVQLLQPKD